MRWDAASGVHRSRWQAAGPSLCRNQLLVVAAAHAVCSGDTRHHCLTESTQSSIRAGCWSAADVNRSTSIRPTKTAAGMPSASPSRRHCRRCRRSQHGRCAQCRWTKLRGTSRCQHRRIAALTGHSRVQAGEGSNASSRPAPLSATHWPLSGLLSDECARH